MCTRAAQAHSTALFCLTVQYPSYYKNVEWPIISAAGIGGRCQYSINNLTKGTRTNHSQPLRWRPVGSEVGAQPAMGPPPGATPLAAVAQWRAVGAEELCNADGLITMVRCGIHLALLAHSYLPLHCADRPIKYPAALPPTPQSSSAVADRAPMVCCTLQRSAFPLDRCSCHSASDRPPSALHLSRHC
jgi:hypothetical protein